MKKLFLGLALVASPAFGQFSTVSCVNGETGVCRQTTTCSNADIQAAINASSSGGLGYRSPNLFDGDGVYVSGGTCNWTSHITWTNKNIEIINAPAATPSIQNPTFDAFDVSIQGAGGPTAASFRISGLTFTGSTSGNWLNVNPGGANLTSWAGFMRIDHNSINYSSSGNVFVVNGPIWGLIDHNTSTWATANFLLQADFLASECVLSPGNTSVYLGEYSGRTLPLDLGTVNALYLEDNTLTYTGSPFAGAISDSSSGGQRMVFRHNTVVGPTDHYAHWSRGGGGGFCFNGEWDGHKYEIYMNNYDGQGGAGYPMRFGSGTGVIYSNTIKNFTDPTIHIDETRGCTNTGETTNATMFNCNGSQAVDGNAGDPNAPGWPCAGQIGTACKAGGCTRSTMDNVPLLAWGNGSALGCSTGGICTNTVTLFVDGPQGPNSCGKPMTNYVSSTPHVVAGPLNGAVDYCQGNVAMPLICGTYNNGYVPLTYPHPMLIPTGFNVSAPTKLGSNPI